MRNWWAYAGLVLAAIFWGASFVATKTLLESLSPATITVFRFGIGLVVIFLLIGPKRVRSAFAAQNLLIALTLGFIGITFHQWLQANGLKTAEATIGSWIVATIPIFVAILGKLFLGESLGFLRIIGIGIASVGALVVIGKGDPFSLMKGSEGVIGDLLFILSAFNWAVFTVISRGVMTRREPRNSGDVGKSKHDRSVAKKDPLGFMFVVMTFGWFFSLIWFILDGGWGVSGYRFIWIGICLLVRWLAKSGGHASRGILVYRTICDSGIGMADSRREYVCECNGGWRGNHLRSVVGEYGIAGEEGTDIIPCVKTIAVSLLVVTGLG
jgi:drug/metabolite transporter (DMT)-like permease